MRDLRKPACLIGVFLLINCPWVALASDPDVTPETPTAEAWDGEAPTSPEAKDPTPTAGVEESESADAVHERRMSQLRRLRDLAVQNDRADMISRADGLIARELKRHSTETEQVGETTAAPAPTEDAADAPKESPEASGGKS